MIAIRNGHIVDPVSGTDDVADIITQNDKIFKISPDLSDEIHYLKEKEAKFGPSTDEGLIEIDATGCIVAPGLMDAHVHFRDPGQRYKEDIVSGAAAAAKGGFTTVVCMANTLPPVDNLDTLYFILEKGDTTPIHILPTATVTKGMDGKTLSDMETLASHGAVGFTDDGLPITDESVLLCAMEKAKQIQKPISLHEEDPLFINGAGVNDGYVAEQIGYGGAARTAEDVMVARDCAIALHTGAKVCIQHISSKNSVELVRLYKRLGARIYAEATPHHFTLTENDVLKYGTNARMNPPLRTQEDKRAIIDGLKDGTIDMIVTDHAPHSSEEKSQPISDAPSGIIGLETSLGLAIKMLVKTGELTLMQLLSLMSKNPASFYGLNTWSITEGSVADIVIFAEDELWTVEDFVSKASNSPFVGWELPGRIHYTICDGKIAYQAR